MTGKPSMIDRPGMSPASSATSLQVLGVILAGGSSRRFGADKRQALLGGRPLLEHVAQRAHPQVALLLVNTHDAVEVSGDLERISDHAPGEGPLAGVLASLNEAERRGFGFVATFDVSCPECRFVR